MNGWTMSYRVAGLCSAALAFACMGQAQQDASHIDSLLGNLGSPVVLSTVPANGDLNPYGVAFVPPSFPQGGKLAPGDILVSNFNNSQNLQGTGTTIVRFHNGQQSVFFQGHPGLGLTTALKVLRAGFVLVGNMPTTDGTSATVRGGSLIAIDRFGTVVWSLSSADTPFINGPWDMTFFDQGDRVQLFISNVLNGTISRIDLAVTPHSISVVKALTISSGYGHRGDPAALEVGPTGLAYDSLRDVLYVAASFENAIFAIPNARIVVANGGLGYRIYKDNLHLHGALAMTFAPNGHLIVSNNDVINVVPGQPSELVEFTTAGVFVANRSVDPALGGSFGLAVGVTNGHLVFAAVDDNTSTLNVWTLAPVH